MADQLNWAERAREALERTDIMVLATVDRQSGTWISPVQLHASASVDLTFLSRPDTRHGQDIDLDSRVGLSVYSWPGPEGGNLGLQVAGDAVASGEASGGWQQYTIHPTEVWCFDSRVDHDRHRVDRLQPQDK